MSLLDEITAKLEVKTPEARKALVDMATTATRNLRWVPNPGPQTEAYRSEADVLLYGGQAGGGKSQLLIGLATQEHQRSIIFRRETSQTDGLVADAKKIIGDTARFNGQDNEFNWSDSRSLKFAGMKEPDDWMKHAGRERDLIGLDEAGEFLLEQVSSVLGWLRGPEGQRCRMVLASNPPRSSDGYWMIEWFAPWLDEKFHNPAVPGELRWAVLVDGKTVWVDDRQNVTIDGVEYIPHSRTFIPARLSDNPERNTPEYISKLQMTPEPLRSQIMNGDFRAGHKDGDMQLIPTAWIIAAQKRWTPEGSRGLMMTAMALDPAGGGNDAAALAVRYGGWYAPVETMEGELSGDGSALAEWCVRYRRHAAPIVVDLGGGYGGSVTLRLKDNEIDYLGFNGAAVSTASTKDGKLRFANQRSEVYWKFREELDPDQEGGSALALPDDPELRADLAAPTWKLTARGIQVEPKVIIGADGKITGGLRKRLGRSPNKGDAVVMALVPGNRVAVKSRMISAVARGAEQGYGRRAALPRNVMHRE